MQQTGDASSPLHSLHFAKPATRTHYILKELRDVGLAGRKVDFLYGSMKICVSPGTNPALDTLTRYRTIY